MAQQPNVELTPGDLPRPALEPAPARRPVKRPGLITTPAEKPDGPGFGTPGPDTGWALRVISHADLPHIDSGLRHVLAALMGARAAHFGRAPIHADLQEALDLVGLGADPRPELEERRRRWVAAIAHEKSPGRRAVAEAGEALYQGASRRLVSGTASEETPA